jgi:hypothetical protein
MSKHTPGPWTIQSEESALDYQMEHWIQAEGEDLCVVNSEADARLIAAAPDLLQVMKEFKSALDLQDPNFDADTWLDRVDAAIAKATGATNTNGSDWVTNYAGEWRDVPVEKEQS